MGTATAPAPSRRPWSDAPDSLRCRSRRNPKDRPLSLGQPHVKRALDWIVAQLADDPDAKRGALIDRASREFDLTPIEADFLSRQLVEARELRKPGPSPTDA
jgi:hypothetical protein